MASRTVPVADGWDRTPADLPDPDRRITIDDDARALRSAFSRLGEQCRQLPTLMIADPPLSDDEIAVAPDRPRGSLGPTRQRCLEQLRKLLPPGLEVGA